MVSTSQVYEHNSRGDARSSPGSALYFFGEFPIHFLKSIKKLFTVNIFTPKVFYALIKPSEASFPIPVLYVRVHKKS